MPLDNQPEAVKILAHETNSIYLQSVQEPNRAGQMAPKPSNQPMTNLWQRIKRGARVVGDFQARLILSLLYFVLVLPTGLILRLGGSLWESGAASGESSYWLARPADDPALKSARRQG
jgi:hypothetical protein